MVLAPLGMASNPCARSVWLKKMTKGMIPTLMRMRAMTIMSMGATAIVAARKMRDLRSTRRMSMVEKRRMGLKRALMRLLRKKPLRFWARLMISW